MEHSMTLVVFTILSQLAIGAFMAFFILDAIKQKVSKKTSLITLGIIIAISIVAVIVSVFHLGHPFAAYRAILNLGQSWLTREILFFPGFILFVILYTFFAKTKGSKQILGTITSLLGAVTIFCTAMIYTIPSMPAWNNGTTMAAFFVTALLLGPVLVQMLVSVLDGKYVDFTAYTLGAAVVAILLNVINLTILKGGFPEAVETFTLLTASPLFWVKLVLIVVGCGIALIGLMNRKYKSTPLVAVILGCFFIAEFVGRMLFYSTGVHL
ncbi:dimethyl sulfoxide reductase anchor subunit family protein [Bacillus massiliigorillae]|uniref:dimethyl sulfoxide reductase anchor subunit family protein n=1 Tax=Bacillus massiliigorillae TaxID=1243664 RepID=UPI00039D2086|nr:DmsC/YnfH family molybdoenzyme membrane anchor subunit [Bacillus massiliigorillae]